MIVRVGMQSKTAPESMDYPGLECQPDNGDQRSRFFRALRRFLRTQFGRPRGFWGHVAGRIMACTPSNHERSRWTVSLLDLQRKDRVLEIGFGPGIAIQAASSIATEGFVAGVDHSEVMVSHAARRNARAVRDGRVALRLGSVAQLPSFDEPFDKVFTINSIHFWDDPVARLRALRDLMKPSGLIAVTIQPRSRNANDEITAQIGHEVVANLERAGFSDCRLEIKQSMPVSIACALGRN